MRSIHRLLHDPALARAVASIAASYGRRELDRRGYDRVMDSSLGAWLSSLTQSQRYAAEFALYSLTAALSERLGKDGFVRAVVTDIVTDAPSEIARRFINGASASQVREATEKVSRDIGDELARLVEQLDDDRLRELLGYDWDLGDPARASAFQEFASLPPEELLERLRQRLKPDSGSGSDGTATPGKEPVSPEVPATNDSSVRAHLRDGTRRVEALREQIRGRRRS